MASELFDIDLVIARLKDQVPVLDGVAGAAELEGIKDLRGFRTPSAFVVLVQETPEPRKPGAPGAARRQMTKALFGVAVAVRNYSGNKGKAASDDLRPVLGAIRDALIGWVPPGLAGARDCQLIQGKVIDYDANTLLWTDIYETQHALGRAS